MVIVRKTVKELVMRGKNLLLYKFYIYKMTGVSIESLEENQENLVLEIFVRE